MIDTHAHLQFKAFEGKVSQVIKSANEAGVEKIIVVGTNLETSRKAVELAGKYEGVFASVGIHPHHVFSYCHSERSEESVDLLNRSFDFAQDDILKLEQLVKSPKVLAIGETGLDRHVYKSTKYLDYKISDKFIDLQKDFFREQIKLAVSHQKALIIHNREATTELLEILEANWDSFLEHKTVFHCCESDHRLLDFAIAHNIFIGVDGDITYDKEKQKFMKHVPLELLVLETDSPYFLPEPLRTQESGLNEPKNLGIIAEFIAKLKNKSIADVRIVSSENSHKLFKI